MSTFETDFVYAEAFPASLLVVNERMEFRVFRIQ